MLVLAVYAAQDEAQDGVVEDRVVEVLVFGICGIFGIEIVPLGLWALKWILHGMRRFCECEWTCSRLFSLVLMENLSPQASLVPW